MTLDTIRENLDELRFVIDNGPLRRLIGRWIEQSYRYEKADSAAEYIEYELEEMMAEYPMYHAPDVARAKDAFPDACEGCEHHPYACPILTDSTQRQWRERLLEDADSPEDELRVYRKQAIDVGCHVIPSKAEEWRSDQRDFYMVGERLTQLALEDAHDEDLSALLGDDDLEDVSLEDLLDAGDDTDADAGTEDADDAVSTLDIGPDMDTLDGSVLDDESLESVVGAGTGGSD